MMDRST